MKRAYTLIPLAFAIGACLAADAPQKPKKTLSKTTASGSKKPAARTVSSTSKGRAATGKALGAKTTKASNVRYVRRRGKLVRVANSTPASSYQLHPDPDRYQQIQQALADKGYFKGEVNGQWNDDSVDALRRFQTDRNLDGDGHLTALSLAGLGLGSKHEADITAPHAAAVPVPNNSVVQIPASSVPQNAASPSLTPVSNPAAQPATKPPDQDTKR